LTRAWVQGGGAICCNREERTNWMHRREFYYYVLIEGIDEFPRNLFVEMELTDDSSDNPMVSLVNAHPSSFP
jgi:hypothetical protein